MMQTIYAPEAIDRANQFFTQYQNEESTDEQKKCWKAVIDAFSFRANQLYKNNTFHEESIKKLCTFVAQRAENLFSNKETASANCKKVCVAFEEVFKISIDLNSIVDFEGPDYIAPDGSQIYLLSNHHGYGLCRCILGPNSTSAATCHKTVTETWTVESGTLEIYRKSESQTSISKYGIGEECEIVPGEHFQFRSGQMPLSILIKTSPVWPGACEAIEVEGYWTPCPPSLST